MSGSQCRTGPMSISHFQLKPRESKEVVLEELVWREGQVLLSASPDLSPEKHRLDIIGLDGSVALRLSFDHAVSNSEAAQRARS